MRGSTFRAYRPVPRTVCTVHTRLSAASFLFFFFNDTATTEIYTLSLHDALPISTPTCCAGSSPRRSSAVSPAAPQMSRSEEHTSELQSHSDLVCRLLLEKKKKYKTDSITTGATNRMSNPSLKDCYVTIVYPSKNR